MHYHIKYHAFIGNRSIFTPIGSTSVRLKLMEGGGVVDEVGGNSKRGLKWDGGGVIKEFSQKNLEIGGG